MKQLQNKVALITGASSGIGSAAAKEFARQGAAVILTARRQKQLEDLVQDITTTGGTAIAISGDIRTESHAEILTRTAEQEFGGLDIAFNNAGILGQLGSAVDMTREDWQETLDVNLTSAFLLAKHQLPALQKRGGGSLIFTSSFVGYTTGMPGMAAYAASKAGLVGLTQVLAVEHGADNIRVNALLPGGTDTAMARSFATTPEAREYTQKLHLLNRLAQPEEIAQSAVFLASDAARFITGQTHIVDGGLSIFRQ